MPPRNLFTRKFFHFVVFVIFNTTFAISLLSQTDNIQAKQKGTNQIAIIIPRDVSRIKEMGFETNSLLQPPPVHFDSDRSRFPSDANRTTGAIEDLTDTGSSGMRLYKITLQPNEKIIVRMSKEKGGEIYMKFLRPSRMDAMESQFRRVAMMPAAIRAKKIDITNITNEIYPVILMVHGQNGVEYELNIERNDGK